MCLYAQEATPDANQLSAMRHRSGCLSDPASIKVGGPTFPWWQSLNPQHGSAVTITIDNSINNDISNSRRPCLTTTGIENHIFKDGSLNQDLAA